MQLLLLSKIGQPYDPVSNTGVIGRNFTHQTMSSVDGFFDKSKFNFNPFIASGAIGMCIDEFNGDNFDHGPLGFVGGGYLGQVQTSGRPIETTTGAAGHAEMGREVEEGRARQLSQHAQGRQHPRQLLQLSRRLSGPRSDLQGPLRPAAGAHDHRFPRQRIESGAISDRQVSPRSCRRWAPSKSRRSRARAPTTSPSTRRRTSTAARSWAPIRRQAR